MRKIFLIVVPTLVALTLVPLRAVTDGSLDGNKHPAVVLLLMEVWRRPSRSLEVLPEAVTGTRSARWRRLRGYVCLICGIVMGLAGEGWANGWRMAGERRDERPNGARAAAR